MVFGRKSTEVKYYFFISYQMYLPSMWFMTMAVDLDHLAEVPLVKFLNCTGTTPPSLIVFFYSGWIYHAQPTHDEWELRSSFSGVQYLLNLFGILLQRRFGTRFFLSGWAYLGWKFYWCAFYFSNSTFSFLKKNKGIWPCQYDGMAKHSISSGRIWG